MHAGRSDGNIGYVSNQMVMVVCANEKDFVQWIIGPWSRSGEVLSRGIDSSSLT